MLILDAKLRNILDILSKLLVAFFFVFVNEHTVKTQKAQYKCKVQYKTAICLFTSAIPQGIFQDTSDCDAF